MKLNLGCGNKRKDGWVNIDCVKTEATDIVRDLVRGLPFADSTADEILCDNVFEHIGPTVDLLFVINECYRVLQPGGVLVVIVPDGRSQAAWQDPTHMRAFMPDSAIHWNQDLLCAALYGITANFDVTLDMCGDLREMAFLRYECTARPK